MKDVLIKIFLNDTGRIFPINIVKIKSELELRKECECLPEGIYYASILDNAGNYATYYKTIIVDDEIKFVKSDYDKANFNSKYARPVNRLLIYRKI